MVHVPEGWSPSPLATCIIIAVAIYVLLYRLSAQKLDPKEPTVIASGIPFVGHILGMALYGGKYIKNLG